MKQPLRLILSFSVTSILLVNPFSLKSQDCPSSMVSYWKLEERTGTTFADSYTSGDINDATAISRPEAVTGRANIGMAQYFNGTADRLNVPWSDDYNWASVSSFTIEFWVKFNNTSGTRVMLGSYSSNAQWWVGSSSDNPGNITWFMRDNDGGESHELVSSTSVGDDSWHHVALVREVSGDAKSSIYIDGQLSSSENIAFDQLLGTGTNLNIGYFNSSPYYYFDGTLDEIAVYNSALPADLIAAHYDNGKVIDELTGNGYGIGYCDDTIPAIVTEPETEAFIGQEFTYDVDASGKPLPEFSLINYPSGMTIDGTTGEISWTPASANMNAQVTVRAFASSNPDIYDEQTFNIFIANEPDCRSNVTAYWSFDLSDSLYKEDEYSGYTLSGKSSYSSSGILEGARNFNGTDDSLNLEITPGGSFFDFADGVSASSFTIEFWVKRDGAPSGTVVLIGRREPEHSAAYWIGMNSSGEIGVFFRDYTGLHTVELYGGSVADNNWHHVVVSYDATSNDLILFVDAVDVANDNSNFDNFAGNDPLNIGWWNTPPFYFFDGSLDEITFYDIALSASDVSDNYGGGNPPRTCQYNYSPGITSKPVTEALEDETYTYNITADDFDDDPVTISCTSKPGWLNFNFTGGEKTATLTGTPGNDHVGNVNITIRVSDGQVNIDQEFTLNVINVNDDPVITSSEITSAQEDNEYSYTLTASDIDEDDLTFYADTLPSWLSFNSTSGLLSGTPDNNDVGEHKVTLRVNDGTTDVYQNFTITVDNTNDIPVISGQNQVETDEDTPVTISLSDIIVTDEDNTQEELTLEIQEGDFYTYSGLTVIPDDDYDTDLTVNITVSDPFGSSEVFGLLVGINPVNDPPVITSNPSLTATEDAPYTYTLEAYDPDTNGDVIKSVIKKPSWLSFNISTGELTGTPLNENVGSAEVILRVSDGSDQVDQTFTIVVDNTNDPPSFASTAPTVADDYEEYSYTILVTDEDAGDVITLSALSIPSWLTLDSENGILSGTPRYYDANKSFQIRIKATDGSENIYQEFTIDVGDENSVPVITSTPVNTILEGTAYFYEVMADDPDEDDELTFTSLEVPDWLTFTTSTTSGLLSGVPTNDDIGSYTVILKVTDGQDDITHSFAIEVKDQNEPPRITSVPATDAIDQGEFFSYTLTAEDPDPDEKLKYSSINLPKWLTFNPLTQVVKGTPGNNDVDSTYSFFLKVTDDIEADSQEVVISVSNVNDPPVITSDPEFTSPVDEESTYEYTFTVIDVDDGDVVTMKADTKPKWLTFDPSTGILSGTPDDADIGNNLVVLKASDGKAIVEQEFTIVVNPVNDAPVFVDQNPLELDIDKAQSIEIRMAEHLFIEDPDNPMSDLTLTILPGDNYTFQGNIVTPIPAMTASGPMTINAKVSDLQDETELQIIISIITDINETFMSDFSVSLYPNPANEEIYIKINSPVNEFALFLYDISGKAVKDFSFSKPNRICNVNVSTFNPGLYFYKIVAGEKSKHGKIMIK